MKKDVRKYIKTGEIPVEVSAHFKRLVSDLMEYESDTFSASGRKLTLDEAIMIATAFAIEDLGARIHTETMDGVQISEELDNLRDFDG